MNGHGRNTLEAGGYWKHDGPGWSAIDQAVYDEMTQTRVAGRFLSTVVNKFHKLDIVFT
jgi:hypothetical protein